MKGGQFSGNRKGGAQKSAQNGLSDDGVSACKPTQPDIVLSSCRTVATQFCQEIRLSFRARMLCMFVCACAFVRVRAVGCVRVCARVYARV